MKKLLAEAMLDNTMLKGKRCFALTFRFGV